MSESYAPPDKRHPPAPSIAYETAARKAAPADERVAALVGLVSGQRLLDEVTALAAFHTRHTLSAAIGAVADHLVARLTAAGYCTAGKVAWTRAGRAGENVVAVKPGSGAAPRLVVLCAHYDCRMEDLGDATSRAPGADDNASGVAALLEIARVLAGVELADTVRFVAFSGEEQGLWGSAAYAAQLAAQGLTVDRLINLDMIGFPPADRSVTVERDLGNAVPDNDAASVAFGAVMADAAATYTSLPVLLGPIYASDYMPFEARGWVTIGAYEGEGNPNYHRTSDDVATLDLGYLTEVTKMTLATLALTSPAATDEAGSGCDPVHPGQPADTG